MEKIPYKCHVLVCVNSRESERKSCGDCGSKEIRGQLKDKIKEKGWSKKDVRVSQSLCMGLCQAGPNVMLYPQDILFSGVTEDDVPGIVSKVEEIMSQS